MQAAQFNIKQSTVEKLKTECLVIGVIGGKQLDPMGEKIDRLNGGQLCALLASDELPNKTGATVLYHALNKPVKRVLLVNLCEGNTIDIASYRSALAAAGSRIADSSLMATDIALHQAPVPTLSDKERIELATRIIADQLYKFTLHDKNPNKKGSERKITFVNLSLVTSDMKAGLSNGLAIADGMNIAKDLGNLAANIATPTYLGDFAKKLGHQHKIKVEVFDRKQIEKLGMHSFLSVAAGSAEPPRFIVMHYDGAASKDAPYVLVGKGVTFDTGGISLKPGAAMDEMKFDMCGAASVIGTMAAVAQMQLAINLKVVVPATENMPSGTATKPGDVIRSMSGQTIEVLNTDAEGRLILCDALTYAERFKPACVIDTATLTGACVIALGAFPSGLFTNDEQLASQLTSAGLSSGDRAWRMPLWDDYQDSLKSNFADMANIGGREGGAITAACFLARYTKAYTWAHLDIAGTAWYGGSKKGSTGRPVPLLCRFLQDRASDAKASSGKPRNKLKPQAKTVNRRKSA